MPPKAKAKPQAQPPEQEEQQKPPEPLSFNAQDLAQQAFKTRARLTKAESETEAKKLHAELEKQLDSHQELLKHPLTPEPDKEWARKHRQVLQKVLDGKL